jgi:hypothetical protein
MSRQDNVNLGRIGLLYFPVIFAGSLQLLDQR